MRYDCDKVIYLPVGAAPEEQAAHADVWTAGVAYGGLMHDTGKLLCDIRVETKNGQPWHPWHGPLTEAYRFKYIPGRDYKLHNAAAAVMVHQVLGTEVMDWISKNQALWAAYCIYYQVITLRQVSLVKSFPKQTVHLPP